MSPKILDTGKTDILLESRKKWIRAEYAYLKANIDALEEAVGSGRVSDMASERLLEADMVRMRELKEEAAANGYELS